MDRTKIAVSAAGAAALAGELSRRELDRQWVPVTLDANGEPMSAADREAVVLWRRDGDRTAWMRRAVASLPQLRWVHTDVVGVERFPLEELAERQVLLTNGVGNFTTPMAEWIVWALLTAAKSAVTLLRASDRRQWLAPEPLGELAGSRAMFLGFGSVGQAAAARLAPFGVEVIAVRRRATKSRGTVTTIAVDVWRECVSNVDYLILTLPLTHESRRILGREALALLKPGAWIINVSRGGLIDEAALCDALDLGRLGGAVLDAFDAEPLPVSSRLWGRENVIVLPHVTASSVRARARCSELFIEQLVRFSAGRPLANVVDVGVGY